MVPAMTIRETTDHLAIRERCVRFARAWYVQSPPLVVCAIAMSVLGLLCFFGMIVDDRALLGLNVWVKPQKFFFSLAIFALTMAWLTKVHKIDGKLLSITVWTLIVALVIEQGLIVMQAARGERSHFNFTSKFNIIVYSLMGLFVAIATFASLLIMAMPLRTEHDAAAANNASPPPALVPGKFARIGIRIGELMFLLGCAFAAWLASGKGHTIGAPDGGPGLPYLSWSTKHIDGRVPHFALLHGLQAMPLLGAMVDRWKAQ